MVIEVQTNGLHRLFAESGHEGHPFVEPGVIVAILLLNAAIGVWQVFFLATD